MKPSGLFRFLIYISGKCFSIRVELPLRVRKQPLFKAILKVSSGRVLVLYSPPIYNKVRISML